MQLTGTGVAHIRRYFHLIHMELSKMNSLNVIREAATKTELNSEAWTTLVHAAQHLKAQAAKDERKQVERNANRRAKHAALTSLGLKRVK